ncbi:helix-turn-helix transcriptional regulator [Streptomyces scopuliridis]|uniref:helix-turn-helix transcriptional regulator n=1 Tax=Streptomyces scopuliridis TaxID=452529 RepID=UPI0034459D4C
MKESPGRRFIGRADELRILRTAARDAVRENPRVVIVSGAAGMGKTALVDHFAEEAGGELTVVRARDVPPKTDLPFYTVTALLADAGAGSSARRRYGPSRTQPSVLSMGGAVIDLLGSSQETGPVLFVLDDAHRTDPESLQAIGFALLRQGADRVLTVICTQHAARTVRDMGVTDLVSESDRVKLTGFTSSETRDFVEDRTARPHSGERLSALAMWSHGNPLFLEAALGAFGGNLPEDPATIVVPSSLSEAVGAWSRSLPPAGLAILNMLAVLDAPASVPLLGQLLCSDRVGADAELLVEQHAAVWVPDGVPTLRLVHMGQRDALYAAIARPERNRMHLRAAASLEPPVRWRHQVAATETYDASLAAELRDAALREARAGHAALAAEYLLASSEVDPDSERRQDDLVSAVRLQVTGGQHRTALRHEEAVLRSSAGPQRDEALGLLGLAKGQDSCARSYLRRALDASAARGDMTEAACVASELGVAEGSLGLGRQSLSTSEYALRHASDEAVRGLAQANLAYGHALIGGPALGLRHVGHLPKVPSRVPATRTDALIYRGVFRGLSGDLTGAITDLTAAARRRNLGVSRISSVSALTHSIWCHFILGEWHEARRNLSVALDIAHTSGRPSDFFALHSFIAVLHAFNGRLDEARAALREVVALEASADFAGPDFHLATTQATVEFAAGDHEKVVAYIRPAVEMPVNESRSRLYAVRHMPILGVAYARTGDTGRARSVLRALEAAEPHGALVPVVVQWLRGAIAAAEGDLEAAADAYRAGLAVVPEGGDPVVHKALTEEDLGTVLLAAGDTEGARRHLSAAERVFARLGAEPFRQRCRTLLDGLDVSPAPSAADAGFGDTLSDRERDIADLVARGWTNREIAGQLYLSVKTVEYHLGNVYAKNDIKGRRQLRDLMQSRRT